MVDRPPARHAHRPKERAGGRPLDAAGRTYSRKDVQLISAVSEEFRNELERILGGGALGPHVRALRGAMRRGTPDLRELLRYGVKGLPPDEMRPDDSLAAYFVILSEFRQCSHDLRIFAAKCVEYCESGTLDGWSESLSELKAAYAILARRWNRAGRR